VVCQQGAEGSCPVGELRAEGSTRVAVIERSAAARVAARRVPAAAHVLSPRRVNVLGEGSHKRTASIQRAVADGKGRQRQNRHKASSQHDSSSDSSRVGIAAQDGGVDITGEMGITFGKLE